MDDEDAPRAGWSETDAGVFYGGRVHVADSMCTTCVFHPGNRAQLRPGRLQGMIRGAIAHQSVITCHHTLGTPRPATCRGFFDRYADRIRGLGMARALGLIVYEPCPDPEARREPCS